MEQEPKPEEQIQEEDLFEWSKKHNVEHATQKILSQEEKPKDDGLGWNCPQCELYGRPCSRHQ